MASIKPQSTQPRTIVVHVPLAIRRRSGRKLIIAPDGQLIEPQTAPRIDNTLIKALALAHHWKRMLESGDYTTMSELAQAEKVNASYLARILRLNLLTPAIVEAILDGSQPPTITLATLSKPFPLAWETQMERWNL